MEKMDQETVERLSVVVARRLHDMVIDLCTVHDPDCPADSLSMRADLLIIMYGALLGEGLTWAAVAGGLLPNDPSIPGIMREIFAVIKRHFPDLPGASIIADNPTELN